MIIDFNKCFNGGSGGGSDIKITESEGIVTIDTGEGGGVVEKVINAIPDESTSSELYGVFEEVVEYEYCDAYYSTESRNVILVKPAWSNYTDDRGMDITRPIFGKEFGFTENRGTRIDFDVWYDLVEGTTGSAILLPGYSGHEDRTGTMYIVYDETTGTGKYKYSKTNNEVTIKEGGSGEIKVYTKDKVDELVGEGGGGSKITEDGGILTDGTYDWYTKSKTDLEIAESIEGLEHAMSSRVDYLEQSVNDTIRKSVEVGENSSLLYTINNTVYQGNLKYLANNQYPKSGRYTKDSLASSGLGIEIETTLNMATSLANNVGLYVGGIGGVLLNQKINVNFYKNGNIYISEGFRYTQNKSIRIEIDGVVYAFSALCYGFSFDPFAFGYLTELAEGINYWGFDSNLWYSSSYNNYHTIRIDMDTKEFCIMPVSVYDPNYKYVYQLNKKLVNNPIMRSIDYVLTDDKGNFHVPQSGLDSWNDFRQYTYNESAKIGDIFVMRKGGSDVSVNPIYRDNSGNPDYDGRIYAPNIINPDYSSYSLGFVIDSEKYVPDLNSSTNSEFNGITVAKLGDIIKLKKFDDDDFRYSGEFRNEFGSTTAAELMKDLNGDYYMFFSGKGLLKPEKKIYLVEEGSGGGSTITEENGVLTDGTYEWYNKDEIDFENGNIPNNEIWYKTSDGQIITNNLSIAVGNTILSNTYENGVGKLKFDKVLTRIQNPSLRDNISLTSIKFPSTIESIGSGFLNGCTSLTSIDLSNTKITTVDTYFLQNCSALESIKLPDSIVSIKGYFLSGCTSLTSIDLSNTKIKDTGGTYYYFLENLTSLESIKLPDTIESISQYFLSGCTSLTSIDLSNTSISEIWSYSFSGCTSLTSVKLPDTIERFDSYFLEGCTSLTSIDLSNTKIETIGNGLFSGCISLTSVKLPDTIKEGLGTFPFSKIQTAGTLYYPVWKKDDSAYQQIISKIPSTWTAKPYSNGTIDYIDSKLSDIETLLSRI